MSYHDTVVIKMLFNDINLPDNSDSVESFVRFKMELELLLGYTKAVIREKGEQIDRFYQRAASEEITGKNLQGE